MGNLEQTICDAVTKSIGRKNAAIIVAMVLIFMLAKEVTWEVLALIAGLACWVSLLQFTLDCVEVWRTGRDLPDSGASAVEKPLVPGIVREVSVMASPKSPLLNIAEALSSAVESSGVRIGSAPEATKEAQVG